MRPRPDSTLIAGPLPATVRRARRTRARRRYTTIALFLLPAVGAAVNDAVQELFAGKASPQAVAGKIADAAKAG